MHDHSYAIRRAMKGDAREIVTMVKSLLTYLGDGIEHFDEARFLEDAFGHEPQFDVLVASTPSNQLVGYALFHDTYEPSYAARGVYLVDLFVKKKARGTGLGKKMVGAVARAAKSRGRTFVWLVTPNEEAKVFYDRVMSVKTDVTAYALTGDNFERMAALSNE